MGRPQSSYTGPTQIDVIREIAPFIFAYVDWYAENGYFLPEEYAKDPAGWAQVLRDIQAAMDLIIGGCDENIAEGPTRELLYDGMEKYYKYSRYLFQP